MSSVKVNLLIDNPGDMRSGHLNIDPFAPEDDQHGRIRGDVNNLDHTVDGGEASEIVALDILDYFPGRIADEILTNWLSKLAHGGKLTVGVIDVGEVARAIGAGTLSHEDVNELLHGKQEKDWQYRKSSYTVRQIAEVLGNLGYKILAKRVQNYRAIVTCQRP